MRCENLVGFLGVKFTNAGNPFTSGFPQSFYHSPVLPEFPVIHQLQSRCFYHASGAQGGFCLWISAWVSCDSLYSAYLFLHFGWRARVSLWLHVLNISRRNCLFFNLFSFLLIFRKLLLSFLYLDYKPEVRHLFLFCFCSWYSGISEIFFHFNETEIFHRNK